MVGPIVSRWNDDGSSFRSPGRESPREHRVSQLISTHERKDEKQVFLYRRRIPQLPPERQHLVSFGERESGYFRGNLGAQYPFARKVF
jgi:hypothetical protein